jgi:hypothetical protein
VQAVAEVVFGYDILISCVFWSTCELDGHFVKDASLSF